MSIDRSGAEAMESSASGEGRGASSSASTGRPARTTLAHGLITAAQRAELDVVTTYGVELYYLGGAPLSVPNVAGIHDDRQNRARALLHEVHQEVAVSAVPGWGKSRCGSSCPKALPRRSP